MNVILFAWCPSASPYIDAIKASGASLPFVVTGERGSAAEALSPACERTGAELLRCGDINSEAFVGRVQSIRPDLLLVAGCSQMLRRPLRAAAALGAVNLHPSLLPSYRGKEPLFWAILRDEPTVGVTAHVITDEIDAGPILLQRAVLVPARATSASLAKIVDKQGAELIPELLSMAERGAIASASASASTGGLENAYPPSHFPALRPEHGLLDWSSSAAQLDRLVRACAGEIHAYTFFRGTRVVLLESDCIDSPAGQSSDPGALITRSRGALLIATRAGALVARSWLFLDRVYSSDDLAAQLDIGPAARFTSNPAFVE